MTEIVALKEEQNRECENGKVILYEEAVEKSPAETPTVSKETPSPAETSAVSKETPSAEAAEAAGETFDSPKTVDTEKMKREASEHIDSTDTFDELEEEFQNYADFLDEEEKKNRFFHSRRRNLDFSRDKWILSRIKDEDLMTYLTLEQKRTEQIQKAKEIRDKRIITTVQLAISLAAVVAVIYFLKDNPVILTNILYIFGILAALWFWKRPKK